MLLLSGSLFTMSKFKLYLDNKGNISEKPPIVSHTGSDHTYMER